MSLSSAAIVGLELVAARAWPAARVDALGGWRLYASSGFSGRINACWPLEDPGLAPDTALDTVEGWYAERHLQTLFKVVESACATGDLTSRLAARGYRARTETIMMTGPATGGDHPDVEVVDQVDDTFARVFAATAHDPADARERLETLARIPHPRAFARAAVDGEPAAIGAGATEGDWTGIFAMRTDPRFRRRGLARQVLDRLLASAANAGATRAWLQVESDNPGAIALYRAAGFTEAYRYLYWER